MYDIKPEEDQITEQLFKAKEVQAEPRYPGSSYEEGVVAALQWLFGANPYPPIDEIDED